MSGTRFLRQWGLETPLQELADDPAEVIARHDEITKEHNPYIANGSIRTLRAVYSHARKANRYLPPDNPATAVDWNFEERRNTGMGWTTCPAGSARSLPYLARSGANPPVLDTFRVPSNSPDGGKDSASRPGSPRTTHPTTEGWRRPCVRHSAIAPNNPMLLRLIRFGRHSYPLH
jgi:hypothetical protein